MQLSVCLPSIHNGCYIFKTLFKAHITEGSWTRARLYWTIGPAMATSILHYNYLQSFTYFLQQKNNMLSILLTASSVPDWALAYARCKAMHSTSVVASFRQTQLSFLHPAPTLCKQQTPLGMFVLNWGVVKRTDGRKWQRHRPTKSWSEVRGTVCFLQLNERIIQIVRYVYTGRFTPLIHWFYDYRGCFQHQIQHIHINYMLERM